MEGLIQVIVQIWLIYTVIGIVFSMLFFKFGLVTVDESAENTTWKFKLLISPGMLIFWPLFALKWKRSGS